MKIGLWCGSLGARSANASLLRVAASRVVELGHEVVAIDAPSAVPAFDPALADVLPDAVAELTRQLRTCDAVAIAAPEYAAGVAGSTKNALDWLVGDATIHRKVIGVASVGTTGGTYAIEHLVRTISWHGGWVVAALGVDAPRTKTDAQGTFTDGPTLDEIRSWTDAMLHAVEGSPDQRAAAVTSIVAPYGIDPARFGSFE